MSILVALWFLVPETEACIEIYIFAAHILKKLSLKDELRTHMLGLASHQAYYFEAFMFIEVFQEIRNKCEIYVLL